MPVGKSPIADTSLGQEPLWATGAPGRWAGSYTQLLDENARLKRDNTQLKHDLELATAVIQRLALENAQLLKAGSNIVPFPPRTSS